MRGKDEDGRSGEDRGRGEQDMVHARKEVSIKVFLNLVPMPLPLVPSIASSERNPLILSHYNASRRERDKYPPWLQKRQRDGSNVLFVRLYFWSR